MAKKGTVPSGAQNNTTSEPFKLDQANTRIKQGKTNGMASTPLPSKSEGAMSAGISQPDCPTMDNVAPGQGRSEGTVSGQPATPTYESKPSGPGSNKVG